MKHPPTKHANDLSRLIGWYKGALWTPSKKNNDKEARELAKKFQEKHNV